MDERRRSSAASITSCTASTNALALPLEARRDLTLALLWSLPRDDIIAIKDDLCRMLQKDIVGNLPAELAVLVLSKLNLEDILRCRLVSRTWAKLCDEPGLWHSFCCSAIPRIRPRHTTWSDLTIHQQLLISPRSSAPEDDEANLDDVSFHTAGGVGFDVLSNQGGLGGGGGVDPTVMTGGLRGMVWERNGSGLPLHVSPRIKRRRPDSRPTSQAPFQAISSHLPVPTPFPRPNLKHLYIVHQILARRISGLVVGPSIHRLDKSSRHPSNPIRPQTIDAIYSIESGGLPGHSESIYALQLISRPMSITMKSYQPKYSYNAVEEIMEDAVSMSRRSSPRAGGKEKDPILGRDWLLSASRDQSLRLCQLSCPRPRVVKVFHGGHTASILCLTIATIPISTTATSPSNSPIRSKRRHKNHARTRLVAVSGGSDGRLCLWDVEKGDGLPEKIVRPHTAAVLCVKADDERVVSASKDRTIRVFNIHTLENILTIDCNLDDTLHRGAINAVHLTKDYILSASGDRTLRVFSVHTGTCLTSIDPGTRGIASMDFSPPPPRSHPALKGIIVIGSSDASIKVYHLVSHVPGVDIAVALDLAPPIRALTLADMLRYHEDEDLSENSEDSDDGDLMNIAPEAEEANRPERMKTVYEPPAELRLDLAGQCWASCSCPSNPVRHVGTAGCTKCYDRGHTDMVRSVHIGEKVILSGSYDSTVKVWDRTTGRLLQTLTGTHSGRIFSVIGDRMRILSAGLDARISIWDFSEGLDTSFIEP